MADIQFEEEQQYRRPVQVNEKSLFIRFVLSTGIVSTDRQAGYVLLGIAVFAIILSFILFHSSGGSPQKLPATVLEQVDHMPVNR